MAAELPTPQEIAELFRQGIYVCDIDALTWLAAFRHLARYVKTTAFLKSKVHTLWTVNGGHLRCKIQDDSLILTVLKKSLPGYQGPGLELYRGECQFLYEQNKIGFCWSPNIEVASKFARGLNALESGGVLLKAFAPPEAILATPNEHSAQQMTEFEYTCDPERLQRIELLGTFPVPGGADGST